MELPPPPEWFQPGRRVVVAETYSWYSDAIGTILEVEGVPAFRTRDVKYLAVVRLEFELVPGQTKEYRAMSKEICTEFLLEDLLPFEPEAQEPEELSIEYFKVGMTRLGKAVFAPAPQAPGGRFKNLKPLDKPKKPGPAGRFKNLKQLPDEDGEG
jgi:hypothetical protein